MCFRLRNWSAAPTLFAMLLAIAAHDSAVAQPGQAAAGSVNCRNENGYSWRLAIDYRRSTVDANPATITPAEISWFDPNDGGHYTLERQTGELTASVASSTGGYFRHARCSLEAQP